MKLNLTNHARQRMNQRGVSVNEVEYIMENGEVIVEKSDPTSKAKRYEDITVVLNWDGSVKTVIRDEKFGIKIKANKLAQEFKSFYEQASQAWEDGNKALAKELSTKGKEKQEECKKLTDQLKFRGY